MKRMFFILMLMPGFLFGQTANIVLDEAVGDFSAPTVAINPKDPANVIVAAAGKIFVSNDGGKIWSESSIASSKAPVDPVVISDRKGDFYYIYQSASGIEGRSKDVLNTIVVIRSTDGGRTWSEEGSLTSAGSSKEIGKLRATTDRKRNVYLSWTEFDKAEGKGSECKSSILFSVSGNRGKKWEDPVQVNQASGNCEDDDQTVGGAMAAVPSDGKIYLSWAHNGKIYLDRSYNEGKTWLRNDIIVTQQVGGWRYEIPGWQQSSGLPVMIADKSNTRLNGMIYLNWSDQRNGNNNTDIWFTSSHNGGDTWSSTVKVNDDASGKHQFMSFISQDPTTGFIYIIFYDRRNYEDNNTDVYLAYSKNGGRSFKNVKISEEPFIPEETVPVNDAITIEASDGVVVPVWTRIENGQAKLITSVIKQEELDKLEEQQ